METRKTLQELTLFDRFLFDETVEVPENMQAMLEIILEKDIVLKYIPQAEKEQRTSAAFRFVKLDVWAQDADDVIYNTEVQKRNTGNLPKREGPPYKEERPVDPEQQGSGCAVYAGMGRKDT